MPVHETWTGSIAWVDTQPSSSFKCPFSAPEAVIRLGPDSMWLAVIMQREPANPSVRILWGKQAEFIV